MSEIELWNEPPKLVVIVADEYTHGRRFFEALTREATSATSGPPLIFYCQPELWAESPAHFEQWFNTNVISTFAGARTVIVFTTSDLPQKFVQIALQTKVVSPTGVELVWVRDSGSVTAGFDAEGNLDPNDLMPVGYRRWHLDLHHRFMGFEPLGDPRC